MQLERMNTQNGSDCKKAYISNEGYKEILKQDKAERLKMMEKLKEDIIGFLYELPDYLNPENRHENYEETKIYNKLTDYLENEKYSFEIQNKILCLANEYGIAAGENGFRRGFQIAMKLCIEGLKGGMR